MTEPLYGGSVEHILDPLRSTEAARVSMCGRLIRPFPPRELPKCSRCRSTNRANSRLASREVSGGVVMVQPAVDGASPAGPPVLRECSECGASLSRQEKEEGMCWACEG